MITHYHVSCIFFMQVGVATCDNDGGNSGKDNDNDGNSNSNDNNTNTNNQTKPITTNENTNSSTDILLSFSPSLSTTTTTTTTTTTKKKKQNKRKASRPLLLLRVDDGTKECKSCILGPKYKHGHDVTCQRSRKYDVGGGVGGVGKDKSKNNTINSTNKGSQTKRTTAITTPTNTNTNTNSYTGNTETLLPSEQNHEQQQCNKKISINQTTMSSSSPKSLLCVAFDATLSLFDFSDIAAAAATAAATAKGDSNSSSSKSTAVVDTSIEVDKKVATIRDSATNETKATVNTRFFGWL